MTLQQLLLILKARWKAVFATMILLVGAAAAASYLMPREYTAQTSVVIDNTAADPVKGEGIHPQMMAGYMATQIDIIRSDHVAQRVVNMADLTQVPAYREKWRAATNGRGSIELWLSEHIRKQLAVHPSRDSSVVTIEYAAHEPALAAEVADAFAQAYKDTALDLRVGSAREFAAWFDERAAHLREELEAAQRRLSDYQREHGVIADEGRLDFERARLAELSSQLVNVQGQRVESLSRQSQAGQTEALPEVMESALISDLKEELARREAQREQLLGRLGPNHPDVRQVEAELASLRERIAGEVEMVTGLLDTSARISTARETEIANAVEAQKDRVLELQQHHDRIAVLRRDVESAQRAYEQARERLTETSLESQARETNIAVLTPAVEPLQHSSPNVLLNLLLATVLGGVFGVGTALLREMRDRRVRSTRDLTALGEIALLGVIPGRARRSSSALRGGDGHG